MFLTRFAAGRFIPWRKVPGNVWGGKQRKVPRLTHSRMSNKLDQLLVQEQNMKYFSSPFISAEVEATLLPAFQHRAKEMEDKYFYDVYRAKFEKRFPNRRLSEHFEQLNVNKRFE